MDRARRRSESAEERILRPRTTRAPDAGYRPGGAGGGLTKTRGSRVVSPYSCLARAYDATLGRWFLHRARRWFRTLARRYGITPRVVADVGCGTGLFARHLARHWGARVYAVDSSPAMLREALARGPVLGVRYLRQDARTLALPERVDLVTANFDVLNHLLDGEDVRRVLARIRKHLLPGGFLVFDLITPYQPRRAVLHRWRLPATARMTQRVAFDSIGRRLSVTVTLRLRRGSGAIVERHRERTYHPVTVARWLRELGYVLRGVHDASTLSSAQGCPPRVIFVAQRPAWELDVARRVIRT